MGTSFRTGFSIPKKKWPLFGRATDLFKTNLSLSASVLQRKLIRQPAQKKRSYIHPD
jgi:hypothetical protein